MRHDISSICSVSGPYVAVYQFQNLQMLSGANIPEQTNANIHIVQTKQLTIEQSDKYNQAPNIFKSGVS